MANELSTKLEEFWKKLPNAINGNGQNFIFLLKNLLKDLKEALDSKFEEISEIANAVTDTPETIDDQLKDCKLKEVRVGTAISFILSWDYSDIKNYESCEIYMKEVKGDISTIIDWSSVEVSRTIRTTKASTYTVDGINSGYVYQIRFQGKNNLGSVSVESGNPILVYSVSALNNVPESPLDFNVYFTRDKAIWSWRQPKGVDYSYSELRYNEDVGSKIGLLEITQDTTSEVFPPTREGTAYLYNKGYGSKYSLPAVTAWSKPLPTAPQMLEATSTYQGLQFTYSEIPEDCLGICISINGNKHYSEDDTYNFYCSTGEYTYKACYYDCFGEGTWTEEKKIGTLETVPPDAVHITDMTVFDKGVIVANIDDNSLVATKIVDGSITTDKVAANAITAGQIASNAITSDKIEANAITTEKIDAGAITTNKIGVGAITADQISSGAITAEKLTTDGIDLAGALRITGGNVTLDENGLTSRSSDGTSVIFNNNGMQFVDQNGNVYNIVSQTCIGLARNGQHITFVNEWPTTPEVIVFPMNIVTSNPIYSTSAVTFHCYATNITTKGFDMVCYAGIANADGIQPIKAFLVNGRSAGRNCGDKAEIAVDDGSTWSFEGDYSIKAPLDGNVSVSVLCWHTAGATDNTGSMQFWLYADVDAYVNEKKMYSTTVDFQSVVKPFGIEKTVPAISWDERTRVTNASKGSMTIDRVISINKNNQIATLHFYANRGQTIRIHIKHRGRCSAGHARGYYNCYSRVEDIRWSFTGEQPIDSNGVGGFIATNSNTKDYTIS